MNFDFLPYQLHADISDFKDIMEYISSDNGVDLYMARDGFIKPLLDFPVTMANLYFFEGSLITAYVQFGETNEKLNKIIVALEKTTLEKARFLETDSGHVYYWQSSSQFLGLLIQQGKNILLLYHCLNKFNVFIQ